MLTKLERVPKIVMGIRFGLLGLAMLCVFVLNIPGGGIFFAALYLVFSTAMRIEGARIWFVAKVTGIPVADLRMLAQQHKQTQAQAQSHQRPVQTQAPEQPSQSPQELEAIIARERREAVLLKRHWPPHVPATQNSWLGGLPNLPDGVDWPENPNSGLALHHLAQIDLAEMPVLDSCPLPRTGMMWFFADIDEELCWEEGADNGQSRVIYHPDSTHGQPIRRVPDNLPEVDHEPNSMTGNLWGFRGPKFSVYPQWPVTGHVSGAWEFSDHMPAGVTDRMGYHAALDTAWAQEREAILGPKPDPKKSVGAFKVFETKQVDAVSSNGQPTKRAVTTYKPQAEGGVFPYTANFARLLLARIDHKVNAGLSSYERQEASAKAKGKEVSESTAQILEGLRHGARLLPTVEAALDGSDGAAPLTPTAQKAFDTLMGDVAGRKISTVDWQNVVQGASGSLVAQAMTQPEVLTGIPEAVVAAASTNAMPSHEYTSHYLGGPKGCASNPTAGKGVRLAQFDSDYGLGMMFCDVGIVDFWIDPDDLAAGTWDRAWAATAGG